MPYELRGSKVVRSDTGAVVKDHKGDRRKALAHLRALKANVEEGVLGALLERFDPNEVRGYHGRWIHSGRVMDLFHGNERVGSVAKTADVPSEFTPSVPGGRTLRPRANMDYAVAGLISHHQGVAGAFPYAEHVAQAKDVISRAEPPSGRHPEPTAGLPPDAANLMRARDRLASVRGVADAGARAQATRAEILRKSPGAQRELDAYREVAAGARSRATGRVNALDFSSPSKALHEDPAALRAAPLSTLADTISRDWGNVNFAAQPYLSAMRSLGSVDDNYGADSGRSIVAYFLSNASGWKGPVAKAVKAELRRRSKR